MKKTVSYLLCLTLCLTLAACARGGEGDDGPTWREQYNLGLRYLEDGHYEEAVIAFEAAIEIDPQRADAYIGLADAYMGLGDEDAARAAIDDAIAACGEQDVLTDWLDAHPEDPPAEPDEGPESPAGPGYSEEPEIPEEPETPEEPEEPAAPAWVLTHQAAWLQVRDEIRYYDLDYTYDGEGYLTACTESLSRNGDTQTRQETWTYSEPGVAVYTPDRSRFETEEEWLAAQEERTMPRGSVSFRTGFYVTNSRTGRVGVRTDPLLDEDLKQTVLAAGGRADPEMVDRTAEDGWSYAQYTFDENGNASHIDTYGPDGALIGSCDLTWMPCPGTENP